MKYCICKHTAKHHKQSGRCRGKCKCPAALIKVENKERAEMARRARQGKRKRLR